MNKNKKIIVGVIIALLIIVGGIVIAYMLIENIVTNREGYKFDKVENLGTNTVDTVSNNKNETENEIVERLYLKELRKTYSAECRIDSVEITKLENKNELYPNASLEAIFGIVTYSIKNTNAMAMAGNGEVKGKWVVNKKACVYVDKDNGEYKVISSGTGW